MSTWGGLVVNNGPNLVTVVTERHVAISWKNISASKFMNHITTSSFHLVYEQPLRGSILYQFFNSDPSIITLDIFAHIPLHDNSLA